MTDGRYAGIWGHGMRTENKDGMRSIPDWRYVPAAGRWGPEKDNLKVEL